ncbi:MAG: hypothetical protein M1820_000225 [Bogoriella megaspora]|nr:MAG: hypothetical protein M1820_000225 [Bogoriella megaspora]
MPTTIYPANHPPRAYGAYKPAVSATSLLQYSCPREYKRCEKVIQSSFNRLSTTDICPSSNGFVQAAFLAYSGHHHLTIRPEDVWFSILTQLSFYINANAEELRSLFVAHEGQKELTVIEVGTINTTDFGALAVCMTVEMERNIKDPEFRTWVMPDFSTTEKADRVTAAVLMMGSMQKYFTYRMMLVCGIPSVTLLGDKEDWVKIKSRLNMLHRLGSEPQIFQSLLTPVLDHFIRSFDDPAAPEVLTFWNKIAHKSGGSGPHYMSGWITAFCFWTADGKCLYYQPQGSVETRRLRDNDPGCDLDGTLFHLVDTESIPHGYVSVPVTVDDNGVIYKTRMVAGSVGIKAWSSGQYLDDIRAQSHRDTGSLGPNGERIPATVHLEVGGNTGVDSIQPVSGWWMYELTQDGEDDKNDAKKGKGKTARKAKPRAGKSNLLKEKDSVTK